MHISRLHIKGFKRFVNFQMNLKAGLNILVGDNETGKTSIIEAITLLLTKQYEGRLIDSQIDPFLFNVADVAAYFDAMRNGRQASPPRIYMEAHFSGDKSDPVYANLQGTNNIDSVDCAGVSLTIELNKDHT